MDTLTLSLDPWSRAPVPMPGNKPAGALEASGPRLDLWLHPGHDKRPLVLICPGGGYHHISEREAAPVARRFHAQGWHAAVLWYRLGPHPLPLWDLAWTMSLLGQDHEAWGVDPTSLVLCGFSAGGHNAASYAARHHEADLLPPGFVLPGLAPPRPRALVLAYPVISPTDHAHRDSFRRLLGDEPSLEALQGLDPRRYAGPRHPPTFLWHTQDDRSVPVQNSLGYYQRLTEAGVPAEMHLFPHGVHGLALADSSTATAKHVPDPHVALWFPLALDWLHGVLGLPTPRDTPGTPLIFP